MVYTALIHSLTCWLEARQALIYQLVLGLGLTGENGKYNYSRAVHLYPPFFDITCSAKNYKIAPALTVGDVRLDASAIWLGSTQPDSRRLEAVDVMLELAESRPQDFSVRCQSPELLRFTLEGSSLRLFTVATLSDPLHSGAQASDSLGRIVWISDSGAVPLGLSLPPKHFFAARQPDGSHRFYGS